MTETTTNLAPLGMTLLDGGGVFGVYSESADALSIRVLDDEDTSETVLELALERGEGGIWTAAHDLFRPGARYVLRAEGPKGPRHAFDPERNLLDPYARGLVRENPRDYHCVAVSGDFDWQGVGKPNTPLSQSIIYEAHLRGLTRINPEIPEEIRGSYAALGHPATIKYLTDLGITAIELLPIHAVISEPRLVNLGLINYWGYNTINFFTPHMRYAAESTRAAGPAAILSELKTAIRDLHRAGIEVILDVVYNHTAEGGSKGLTYSYRGLDNSNYYRQDDAGTYHDTTGCGNSLNFGNPMVHRMVMDSLRYWTQELQIDGYRFDLASTLARNEDNHFDPNHPLLEQMQTDPITSQAKLIMEPWDVGLGGWQTGNFPAGLSEWNDRYRDSVRRFWLTDVANARHSGRHHNSVADLATRLAGSQDMMSDDIGPSVSVNFVTAHDGFTLHDLVSYNEKNNSANGEGNRDGTNNNHSYNHGAEGPTNNPSISFARRKAMRNLIGTLLLSAGVPMLTAGDERAKTQGGNNNAYCQDNVISWMHWDDDHHRRDLFASVAHLIRLRKGHAVLRPDRFTGQEPASLERDQMLWFNARGKEMTVDDWNHTEERVLQRYSERIESDGESESMLLVINGNESVKNVALPEPVAITGFELLWDSALELPPKRAILLNPGARVRMVETSMQLYVAKR